MEFHATWTTRAGVAVVTIVGEVDGSVVPGLRRALAAAAESRCRCVVVDLAGATFLDASGLGAMLGAALQVEQEGGQLALAGARPSVRRVLEATGVDGRLEVYPSVDAAIASNEPAAAYGAAAETQRRARRVGLSG